MSATLADRLRHLMQVEAHQSPTTAAHKSFSDLTEWSHTASQNAVQEGLKMITSSASDCLDDPASVSALLVGAIRRKDSSAIELTPDLLRSLREIYPQLESHPAIQCLLLRLSISTQNENALRLFAELLVNNKPLEPRLQVEVFGDLLGLENNSATAVFPTLLNGLDTPGLSSYVLEYANYVYRNELFEEHPAAQKSEKLFALLSQLSDRLWKLQDITPESDEDAVRLGKQVTDSVALGIALCDALACIGDPQAIASLNKTLQIEHRRLRVEAAAALAKLGVEDAKKILTAMAADPIERLRVLSYAGELDLLSEVDEEFSSIAARAEAEFVMHLAQPSQVGIAPQHIELIDQREQAWPGYEEPRNCFLFQFVYQFPSGEFTNIGIAGPVVMTFNADLTGLTGDDIYALFAGWHVQHPEIFSVAADRVAGQEEIQMQRMKMCLTETDEYEDVVPVLMGMLFERRVLIASARRNGETGWAMVSEDAVSWLSLGTPERPLGADEAFHLFVGRSLLKSFN